MMKVQHNNNNVKATPSPEEISSVVEDKLNGLINRLNAVVSIGTSHDEEEVLLSNSGCDGSNCENRNDEESGAGVEVGELEGREAAAADEEEDNAPRDSVNPDVTVESKAKENDTAPQTPMQGTDEAESTRVKFGTHMIRDSVVTNETTSLPAASVVEENKDCFPDKEKVDSKETDADEEESINHLFGLVSHNESLCTRNDDSEHNKPKEQPIRSILKKSTHINSTKSMRRFTFGKRKQFSISPFLRKQNRVKFTSISLRTYDIILGDHPNCKFGAPISIGWEYQQCHDISLEIYEKCRGERRKMKKLYLNSACRRRLLTRAGFSIEEISDVVNEVQMIRLMRQESVEEKDDTRPFVVQSSVHIPSLQQQSGSMKGWDGKKNSMWMRIKGMVSRKRSKF